MADYYTGFSVLYVPPKIGLAYNPIDDKELEDLLVNFADYNENESNPEGFIDIPDYKVIKDGVWIYTEACGNIEAAVFLIQRLQVHYGDSRPFVLTWAGWCSKPAIDSFTGGAVVITKEDSEWMEASDWASQKITNNEIKIK